MKISKNVQGKKYIYFFITMSAIFCLILGFSIISQNKQQTKIINTKIGQIVGEVKKQYPEIDDEQIIKILNEEKYQKDF